MYKSLVYAQLYRSVMYNVKIIGLPEMYLYRSLVSAQLYRSVMHYVHIIGLCTIVYISDALYTDHWFMLSCIYQ